jgi:hypothetical protein
MKDWNRYEWTIGVAAMLHIALGHPGLAISGAVWGFTRP